MLFRSRDFIGPVRVEGSGRAIYLTMQLDGQPAVDVMIFPKAAGEAALQAFMSYGAAGPLPMPPIMGEYTKPHTRAWSERIASFDGFVFVTPEYNHGISGALKNAIDFVYKEWNNKAAGFVGYGSVGAVRAVEHLRLGLAECQVATVRSQVALSLFADFENFTVFKPGPSHGKSVSAMLDQVVAWSRALQSVRA